jgi:hypothetical protein
MWFSLNRTQAVDKPHLSTGNLGKPRDLRFCGPFMDILFVLTA